MKPVLGRRGFLCIALVVPVSAACRRAGANPRPPSLDAWPGPTTPVSYVTTPPPAIGDRLVLTDAQWRTRLTRAQYEILRTERTEPSFSCELWREHREGTFFCGGCGAPLFASRDKFESGTGWASFTRPIEAGRLTELVDRSSGMTRTEVRCARCDGHLGHVFDDGPRPTGLRYCINGTVLTFVLA